MKLLTLGVIFGQALVLSGCNGGVVGSGTSKPAGSPGAPCRADRTCDPGLGCNAADVCEADAADPCDGVTCGGHGTCALAGGSPVCACDEGYASQGLDCVGHPAEDGGAEDDGGAQHDGAPVDAGAEAACEITTPGTLPACFRFYPADFYWNVPVDTLPVDANSETYIAGFGGDTYLYAWQNAAINLVDASTPRKKLHFRLYDGWDLKPYSDDILYPIPPAPDYSFVDPNGENHYYMLDPLTNELWEIYDGRINTPTAGEMSAVLAYKRDLTSYALRPAGWPSVSVSGLDPVPGMVRKAEIQAGVIDHAIMVAVYHQQDTAVWPSRRGSPGAAYHDPSYPPCGQRFRLKESFDISGYGSDQRVVLTALKKYGFIAMENSNQRSFTMHFEKNMGPGWGSATFANVRAPAFEAVDASSMMISPDSGQCLIP
jgi:hypothetical protein